MGFDRYRTRAGLNRQTLNIMKTVETKAWSELEIAILKLCISVNGVGKWELIRT